MCKGLSSKITLVGAGPGDPDLLTLKGLKALQNADVVLYDALINTAILEHAPKSALKIYVGKRANNHSYTQEEINLMLVQFAFSHGHVVRLKGGDPFVFGRGHEEMMYSKAFGVPTTVIPGISSCIAVPELSEIPVTRRGLSESFWVLTGTTRSGQLSKDVVLAAQSSATAIILMGMRKIHAIAAAFSAAGKANTPVLVVQNGSRLDERKVLGTIATISDQVEEANIGAPGIIIIGEVVRLHPELQEVAVVDHKQTLINDNARR